MNRKTQINPLKKGANKNKSAKKRVFDPVAIMWLSFGALGLYMESKIKERHALKAAGKGRAKKKTILSNKKSGTGLPNKKHNGKFGRTSTKARNAGR